MDGLLPAAMLSAGPPSQVSGQRNHWPDLGSYCSLTPAAAVSQQGSGRSHSGFYAEVMRGSCRGHAGGDAGVMKGSCRGPERVMQG